MKKIIFTLIYATIVATLCAQSEIVVQRDTVFQTVEISQDKHRVETNYFKDNWFINLGGGAQMFYGDHTRQMKLMDRFSPAVDFSVGKWFTPGIAVRAAASGLNLRGVSGWSDHSGTDMPNVNWYNYQGFIVNAYEKEYTNGQGEIKKHWAGDVYGKEESGAYDLYKTNIKYINAHIDVMFNLTNMILGYNPNRFYSFIPYLGVGWITTLNEGISRNKLNMNVMGKRSNEVSANVGLVNEFRLSDALFLNLDVRGVYLNDRFDQQIGGRFGEGILSGTLGLTYKFNQRHWGRSTTTTIRYNESELQALRDRLNELAAANQRLKYELDNVPEAETVVEKSAKETILAGPLLVTFVIDRWDLSNEARVNLGFLAQRIKENPEAKFVIVGYADRGTGTASRNQFLSQKRSEVVYNCLVREFDVAPSQLEMQYEGGVENMYYDDPRLSRSVITKIEK